MRIRRKRSRLRVILIWAVLVLLVATLGVGGYILKTAEHPPTALIAQLQQQISMARLAEAQTYAPNEIQLAEARYETAMTLWKGQNQHWYGFRDFKPVADTLLDGLRQATEATGRAQAVRDSLREAAYISLTVIRETQRELIADRNAAGDRDFARRMSTVDLTLRSGFNAFARNDFRAALRSADQASSMMSQSRERMDALIHGYLTRIPEWNVWVHDTIRQSKQDGAAIVVVKMERQCRVYMDGKLHHTFPIELGRRWFGEKEYQGDARTPEGQYLIIRKKERGHTKYYKALEINYPNENDKQRFRRAKTTGQLTASARIGGLIEIHGEGGKGSDWTEGCVALKNEDMDLLYRLARTGTRVTIVGALERPPNLNFAAKRVEPQAGM